MPEGKRRVVKPPEPVEPVEQTVELTGVTAKMFRCPVCGRSSEDKQSIVQHIGIEHPGGEA